MSADLKTERDVLMYRAYIAQKKYGVVLDGIRASSDAELRAVRTYAEYLSSESRRWLHVIVVSVTLILYKIVNFKKRFNQHDLMVAVIY